MNSDPIRALAENPRVIYRANGERLEVVYPAAIRAALGDHDAKATDTLAAITALATAACAERRRGCPTYGLVRAADIQRLVEEAKAT